MDNIYTNLQLCMFINMLLHKNNGIGDKTLLRPLFQGQCTNQLVSTFYGLNTSPCWQVQIQGEQGQTVGQVLQVASPTQQQLQGVTTTQLVQQGELTEEQQQQVMQTYMTFYSLCMLGKVYI